MINRNKWLCIVKWYWFSDLHVLPSEGIVRSNSHEAILVILIWKFIRMLPRWRDSSNPNWKCIRMLPHWRDLIQWSWPKTMDWGRDLISVTGLKVHFPESWPLDIGSITSQSMRWTLENYVHFSNLTIFALGLYYCQVRFE